MTVITRENENTNQPTYHFVRACVRARVHVCHLVKLRVLAAVRIPHAFHALAQSHLPQIVAFPTDGFVCVRGKIGGGGS